MPYKSNSLCNWAPVNAPEGTEPVAVRVWQATKICEVFERDGISYHSPLGATLWVTLTYCKANNIPYECTKDPTTDYWIVRKL